MTNQPKMVIGVDQSYKRTGIGISVNGKCVAAKVINMERRWYHINDRPINNDCLKRRLLKRELEKLVSKYNKDYEVIVIFERIRPFSSGHISFPYIISTGALVATIIDVCFNRFIRAYSVDTRSWKAQVVGTSKPDAEGNKKGPTLKWVNKNLKTGKINPKIAADYKDGIITSDDLADAICISLYGFVPKGNRKLDLETPDWGFGEDGEQETEQVLL